MSDKLMASTSRNKNLEIVVAINLVKNMAKLASGGSLNIQRFEACQSKVLSLQLSRPAKSRIRKLLDSANRYIENQEIGALRFELDLLAHFLRKQAY